MTDQAHDLRPPPRLLRLVGLFCRLMCPTEPYPPVTDGERSIGIVFVPLH